MTVKPINVLSTADLPIARDEMDDAAFHNMMERGMQEAKAGKSRSASEVFAELRREIQKP